MIVFTFKSILCVLIFTFFWIFTFFSFLKLFLHFFHFFALFSFHPFHNPCHNPGVGQGSDRLQSCQFQNSNSDSNCAVRACSVEGVFVDNVFALLLSGGQADVDTYSHYRGFDPTSDCPVKQGVKGASGEKRCCGVYPNRYPFKTLDRDRACCGSRTYNTNLLNCCANGQVKANC